MWTMLKQIARLAVCGLSLTIAMGAEAPPNLIVFLTDQQRVDTLGAYGNDRIKTPHLDALAQRGFLFESFYVANPICSPSRASLLTGVYPHQHGTWKNNIPLNPAVPILVEMLEKGIYASAYYGKWHLGNEIFKQRGFTDFDSTEIYEKGWSPDKDHAKRSGYYHFLLERHIPPDTPLGHSRDLANRLPKELSKPVYLARKGMEFIEEHRDEPFVLFLSFLAPHAFADHHQGPPFNNVYEDLYDPEDMEIPATFFEEMDPTVSYAKRIARLALIRGEFPIAYPQTIQELKQAKSRYWGLVTLVDEMVGRVLEHLKKLDLEKNTIVVFTSEHGEMLGDHRLMSKAVSYEESVKVPFVMTVPGVSGPRRISQPVSQVDVVPTLLELMGQSPPSNLQGESWAPFLRNAQELPDRDVIIFNDEEGFAQAWNKTHVSHRRTLVTPEGWKLSVNDTGEGELYHLGRDPKERRNLYFQAPHQAKVRELWGRLRARQRAIGDSVGLDLDAAWPTTRGKGYDWP